MRQLSILLISLIISGSAATFAQKTKTQSPKTPATLSTAEKLGYARTNKYWGPGTYYCYAPGKPLNPTASNALSAMRDLTGISEADFRNELKKQGFKEIPAKETSKTWYNDSKNSSQSFFFSADKSYVLKSGIKDMYNSPATETGKPAMATSTIDKYQLIPVQDSLKVINAIWQHLRDVNELKLVLGSIVSTFKKAEPKSYPIQQIGAAGWTGLRGGTFVLKTVDGKPIGYWESVETILRRTMGQPGFTLKILSMETDYWYGLTVKLQKEGYVLSYSVVAITMNDLEPGNTWIKEYPNKIREYNNGVTADKTAVELYKKSPCPPVLQSLDKALKK